MRYEKFLFLLLFNLWVIHLYSQSHTQGIALNIGYSYINTNAGYVGGEYTYRINPSNWHGIAIGAGGFYGSFNGNFKFIPEAHLTYSNFFALGEFSVTPYNINPSIGLSLANFVRLKAGYSWKLGHENVRMTGVTFGLNILLGSQGNYDYFMICPPPNPRHLDLINYNLNELNINENSKK